MQPRRPYQISSPWSPSEFSKRGGTAPRPEKADSIFVQSRVPTSSSKYGINQMPTSSISISVKGSGFTSQHPRQPVKVSNSVHGDPRPELKFQRPLESPIPEDFEHVWEEGTKRPKTQNIKCRRTSTGQEKTNDFSEIFPGKGHSNANKLYDVPVIVVKEDKNRKIMSAHKTSNSKYGARPSTNKPVASLMSSLDQDFLDLFQV